MGKFNLLTTLSLNASGMSEGLKKAITEVESFVETSKAENKSLNTSFRDVTEMGIGEMRKEMMKLRNISFAGKSQEEIMAINARIGELMDSMGDLKAQQKALGTEFGTAMAGGLQTISAVAEGIVGVASLFGASKEQAEKYQQVMVSLIGVTQAMGVVQDAMETRQFQNIALKIKETAVTATHTVATWAQTAAQWALNASMLVLIGTIGAVVVVVGALVAGIYLLVRGHNDAAAAAEAQSVAEDMLNKKIEEGKIVNDQMLKLAKARGASEVELKQLEIGAANNRLLLLKKQLDAQLDVNGVLKEGVKAEDRKKQLDDFRETSDAMDVMIVELDMLSKKTEKHTEVVKQDTKAMDQWVDAALRAQYLQDFNVPRDRSSLSSDAAPIGSMTGKGISVKPGSPGGMRKMPELSDIFKTYKDQIATLNQITQDGLSQLAGSFSQGIADMITGDGGLSNFFAGVLSTLGQFMKQMGAAVIAYAITMEAFKKAFTNPLAALAAGIGLMIAGGVVMNYANKLNAGKFANGGIVGGSSFSGDRVSARVNSGEMILNQAQQGQLFALANGGGANSRLEIFGTIKAGDIYLSNKRGAYLKKRQG